MDGKAVGPQVPEIFETLLTYLAIIMSLGFKGCAFWESLVPVGSHDSSLNILLLDFFLCEVLLRIPMLELHVPFKTLLPQEAGATDLAPEALH